MKLLIYSHYFAPSIGGVETVVQSLASGLAEYDSAHGDPKFNVTLVTNAPAGDFNDSALGFTVFRNPGFTKLWQLIRAADVVHLAGPALPPLLASVALRKPVVIEHHGFHAVCPNGQLFHQPSQSLCPGHFMAGRHGKCLRCNASQGASASLKLWFYAFVRRFLSKRANANVTPTRWLAGLLSLPRSETVFHGLDPSGELFHEPNEVPIVVFQGRLVATKGVPVLLEAVRDLHLRKLDFELHIIGDGPECNVLVQLADAWGLASVVRFLGSLPASQLQAHLSRASVVVVPSLAGEVFGLVVAENMLRGLPVLASDLGAFVEIMGEAGVTFRSGDSKDLARLLAELLEDSARRANLSVSGRARAFESFSRKRMIDAHASLYRNLCA